MTIISRTSQALFCCIYFPHLTWIKIIVLCFLLLYPSVYADLCDVPILCYILLSFVAAQLCVASWFCSVLFIPAAWLLCCRRAVAAAATGRPLVACRGKCNCPAPAGCGWGCVRGWCGAAPWGRTGDRAPAEGSHTGPQPRRTLGAPDGNGSGTSEQSGHRNESLSQGTASVGSQLGKLRKEKRQELG